MKKNIRITYKLLILLLLTFIIPTNSNIYAYTAESFADGKSKATHPTGCGDILQGCGYWTAHFTVRVGLFTKDDDGNLRHVEGSQVVQFTSSRDGETYSNEISFNKYGTVMNGSPMIDYRIDHRAGTISFSGMTLQYAGTLNETDVNINEFTRRTGTTSTTEYTTYIGLDSDYEDGFESYNTNRKKFIQYVTSLKKNTKIPYSDKKVSFIDFFLKVSGYNNDWEADSTTRNKFANGEYFLVIEPVYSYGVEYTDGIHWIEGTAKQLLGWASYNAHNNEENPFWVAYDRTIVYNYLCNFIDTTNTGNFYGNVTHNEDISVCNNFDSFLNDFNSGSNQSYELYVMYKLIPYRKPGRAFGQNIVSLKQYIKSIKKDYYCNLEITSCGTQNNNNFIYSSELSLQEINESSYNIGTGNSYKYSEYNKTLKSSSIEDLYNCVYPENAEATELEKYISHYGTDGNDLWCYDNVTYDFSGLKKLDDQTFNSNQYIEIPSGKLTVNRTCYTKVKTSNAQINELIDRVLVRDDANAKYQNYFNFTLNGRNFRYTRNSELHRDTSNYETTEIKDMFGTVKTKIYTTKFYYYYNIQNGIDTNSLNININNYSTNNIVPGTNTIEFIKKFDNSSLIHVKSNTTLEDKNASEGNFENSISADSIENALGLSSKISEQLKISNGASIEYDSASDTKATYKQTTSSVKFRTIVDNDNKCEFNTSVQSRIGFPSEEGVIFRTISLTNPFPARDGTSRIAGKNWINQTENNVYNYIEKNRNVNTEEVYNKEPLYKITLTPSIMTSIREYNKSHSYNDYNIKCEEGTGRMCLSEFLRNSISTLEGTCSTINVEEVTKINKEIKEFEDSKCNEIQACLYGNREKVQRLDHNGDGKVTEADYINADFYKCADKTASSGGPNK